MADIMQPPGNLDITKWTSDNLIISMVISNNLTGSSLSAFITYPTTITITVTDSTGGCITVEFPSDIPSGQYSWYMKYKNSSTYTRTLLSGSVVVI